MNRKRYRMYKDPESLLYCIVNREYDDVVFTSMSRREAIQFLEAPEHYTEHTIEQEARE